MIKFLILFALALLLYDAHARAEVSNHFTWPVVYPSKLLYKAPVTFPLGRGSAPYELPAQFVEFVLFVKNHCRSLYRVNYSSNLPSTVDSITRHAPTSDLKIACSLPVISAILNDAGTTLQKFAKLQNHKSADLPATLASSALDIGFETIAALPNRGTELLLAIRTISKVWPYVLAESAKWIDGSPTGFNFEDVRLIEPWVVELSAFNSVSRFYQELPCSDVEGEAACRKVAERTLQLLQDGMVRIKNSPTLGRFLNLSDLKKTSVLPAYSQIWILNTIFKNALDDDAPFMYWADNGVQANATTLWKTIFGRLKFTFPNLTTLMGQAGFVDWEQNPDEFTRALIRSGRKDLPSYLRTEDQPDGLDFILSRSISYGFYSITYSINHLQDPKYLRKFLSLRTFLNIREESKKNGFDDCTRCAQKLSPRWSRDVENLIGDLDSMGLDAESLLLENANNTNPATFQPSAVTNYK